ncbi:hypothetical protein [Solibacillus sp. FSL K6-1523]|uniref:hypothetical protein n=1 Tax=Solibacillus sp. FSL K6-1523 TaxID=2921471 RepID=UPI0030F7DA57
MENKTNAEELLHQQLELLAERSANEASVADLPQLTLAMIELYKCLPNKNHSLSWDTPELETVE